MNIFNRRSEQRKLLELLLKKSYKKQINLKKEFRIENVIQKKGDELYVKRQEYDNSFNRWTGKNCISEYYYFPEPHSNKNKIEVKLDWSNYATQTDLQKEKN